MKQYLFIIEPTEEVGRMLGGWSRAEDSPKAPPDRAR